MTTNTGQPLEPKAEAEGGDICQLQGIIHSSPPAGRNEEPGLSPAVRIKRALHRGLSRRAQKKIRRVIGSALDLLTFRGRAKAPAEDLPAARAAVRLEAGDTVRVRSRQEIEATLDRWGYLKGCGFLSEMAGYCGTTRKVLKRVERFIDERDYRLKKASGIVLLEGLMCSGMSSTGRCDRSCLFFWREEWLEKLEQPE
jgi:hypothetical protein